jgi:hypothetical protein
MHCSTLRGKSCVICAEMVARTCKGDPQAPFKGRSLFEDEVGAAIQRLKLRHKMDTRSRDGFMHFDFLFHHELECASAPQCLLCLEVPPLSAFGPSHPRARSDGMLGGRIACDAIMHPVRSHNDPYKVCHICCSKVPQI